METTPTPNTPTSPGSAAAPGSSTTLVIVALLAGLIAVVLVNVYVETAKRSARPNSFTIYRLTRSLEPGDKLSQRDVEPMEADERFRDFYSNALDEAGVQTRLGETVYRPADMGAPLTYDLFRQREEDDLDRRITEGMRLVALPVNPRTLPGTLRPGMYVDIEAPFQTRAGTIKVLPVMERVRVMAVGRRSVIDEANEAGGRMGNFSTISIEVEPRQATQLSMIEKLATGDFELHLRKPGDDTVPKIPTGGLNPDVVAMLDAPPTSSTTDEGAPFRYGEAFQAPENEDDDEADAP